MQTFRATEVGIDPVFAELFMVVRDSIHSGKKSMNVAPVNSHGTVRIGRNVGGEGVELASSGAEPFCWDSKIMGSRVPFRLICNLDTWEMVHIMLGRTTQRKVRKAISKVKWENVIANFQSWKVSVIRELRCLVKDTAAKMLELNARENGLCTLSESTFMQFQ